MSEIDELDKAAAEAKKRMEDAAKQAEEEIAATCTRIMGGLNLAANKAKERLDSPDNPKISQNNFSWRLLELERIARDLAKQVDKNTQSIALRDAAISVEKINHVLNLSTTLPQDMLELTKQLNVHCRDTANKFSILQDKVDKLILTDAEYMAVITPKEAQKIVKDMTLLAVKLGTLQDRFEEFHDDRIRRLDETNNRMATIDNRIDRNQIRSQQYVIGIVVGLIVTIITSAIFVRLGI